MYSSSDWLAQECIKLINCVLQMEATAKHLQGLQIMDAYLEKLATKGEDIERQRVRPHAVLASIVLGYPCVVSNDASAPANVAGPLHKPQKCLVHTASDSMGWAML